VPQPEDAENQDDWLEALKTHLGAPKEREELEQTDGLARRAVMAFPGGDATSELMSALERSRTDKIAPLGFLTQSKSYRPDFRSNAVDERNPYDPPVESVEGVGCVIEWA
jgi:hypothetical protein